MSDLKLLNKFIRENISKDVLNYWYENNFELPLYDWCTVIYNEYILFADKIDILTEISNELEGDNKKEIVDFINNSKIEIERLKSNNGDFIYEFHEYYEEDHEYCSEAFSTNFEILYNLGISCTDIDGFKIEKHKLLNNIEAYSISSVNDEGYIEFTKDGIIKDYYYCLHNGDVIFGDPDSFKDRYITFDSPFKPLDIVKDISNKDNEVGIVKFVFNKEEHDRLISEGIDPTYDDNEITTEFLCKEGSFYHAHISPLHLVHYNFESEEYDKRTREIIDSAINVIKGKEYISVFADIYCNGASYYNY